MKKMMILGALALTATQQTRAFDPESNWKLYAAAAVVAHAVKPVAQYAAIAGGVTAGIWGLWSMGPHLRVVERGYEAVAHTIEEFAKKHPNVKTAAQYSAPAIALPVAYCLIKWGSSNQ